MLHRRSRESESCRTLREAALRFPAATLHHPWDHVAVKVKNRTFVFLADGEEQFSLSCKLKDSHDEALTLPFCEPTGYGLGKSGWVTATFPEPADAPLALLLRWIDESYRLIAPKTLVATLGGAAAPDRPVKKAAKKAAKKTVKKATRKAARRKATKRR